MPPNRREAALIRCRDHAEGPEGAGDVLEAVFKACA